MRNIGRYQILGLLGRGGMSRVYKVLDPDTKQLMALKLLWPNQLLDSQLGQKELQTRFLAEARAMQAIEDAHISRVLDWGQDCGLTYMVQEYLCLNLSLLIGEARQIELPTRILSPLKALDITRQTLLGLHRLHQAGIVHRDIKPANLLLSLQEEVKIIDLGLSRLYGEIQNNPPGMLVGSPYYAAPEQMQDPERAEPSADLYSLAVVLYRMVTGQLPDQPQGLPAGNSLLGTQWKEFLQSALAQDPGQRFVQAQDMLQAVQALKQDWERRRQDICKLPEPQNYTWDLGGKALRKEPLFTGRNQNWTGANLDRLLQLEGYLENQFSKHPKGILDSATGLIWGYAVSKTPLNQQEALDFVGQLASDGKPWRLPTLEELLSLLQPRNSLEEACRPPLEQLKGISRLWSVDRQTKSKAWILDLDQGAVLAQDKHCRFHAIPVRDA
ncbi:MAG: protein kinase domain-containing protein [Desulfohalobiaceae bacterium]